MKFFSLALLCAALALLPACGNRRCATPCYTTAPMYTTCATPCATECPTPCAAPCATNGYQPSEYSADQQSYAEGEVDQNYQAAPAPRAAAPGTAQEAQEPDYIEDDFTEEEAPAPEAQAPVARSQAPRAQDGAGRVIQRSNGLNGLK